MAIRYGLTRYNPFRGLMPLEREMDRFFGHSLGWSDWPVYVWRTPLTDQEFFAPLEVLERDGQTVIRMELPGVDAEDVDISISDGVLTVTGEKKHEEEVEEGGVHRTERSYGSFSRSISVPEGLDEGKVSATLDNGVLELLLPRAAEKQEHKVPIAAKTKTTAKAITKRARAKKVKAAKAAKTDK
jgi:HSP20 family protein